MNFINEPHLFITFNSGKGATFNTHITNDVNGPISPGDASATATPSANIPMKQFATYFQDDWRVSDRLTLNFGLRYDLMTGYQFDESKNPNFVAIQAAGAAGKLAGIVGLENFGQTPQEDHNNFQPRVGAVYDVRGNGKDIVRGGWGVYTDVGYTNSNVLFAASDSTGEGLRPDLQRQRDQRHRKEPRTARFYKAGQPLSEHREPEPDRQHRRVPAERPVRRSAPAAALSDAEQRRLVARADERHGDLGGLRQLARPRPQLPAALNQRIPGSLSNPRRVAARRPDDQPEHQRQPPDGQPRRERRTTR